MKCSVKSIISFNAMLWLTTLVRASYLEDKYSQSVIDDASLDTMQLLKKDKYPAERHYVTTEDQYILQMHRIPKPGAPPVFLMHGLLACSSTWIVIGANRALGYYLSDSGYDVWMGNARGNRYSRNHTTFNPDFEQQFWTFSWHEIGVHDLPAMIDYVLKQTGFKKTAYFGHSQGTTSFFVMASMKPEYNEKITIMHALAPVAFMKHLKPPLLPLVKNMIPIPREQLHEFLPYTDILWRLCFLSELTEYTCLMVAYEIMGKEEEQMDMTILPRLFGPIPAGCNFKQVVHYMQLIDSDRFCQYDYGHDVNEQVYGNSLPPDYPVEKITAPIGLYYTYNDYLSSEVDVKRLIRLLPNVAEDSLYPHKKWNHITMLYGKDAREMAHKRMLEVMKNYSYD